MSKAVLMSIQPKWCELIASGKKRIEIRKTIPKFERPFKVYIYMTKKGNNFFGEGEKDWFVSYNFTMAGKIIGEFVCEIMTEWHIDPQSKGYFITTDDLTLTCLTYEQLHNYGNGQTLYGWHISNLVIYDEPKELSEFRKTCVNELYCESCAMYSNFYNSCGNKALRLKRPPQSWCYVEELSE